MLSDSINKTQSFQKVKVPAIALFLDLLTVLTPIPVAGPHVTPLARSLPPTPSYSEISRMQQQQQTNSCLIHARSLSRSHAAAGVGGSSSNSSKQVVTSAERSFRLARRQSMSPRLVAVEQFENDFRARQTCKEPCLSLSVKQKRKNSFISQATNEVKKTSQIEKCMAN